MDTRPDHPLIILPTRSEAHTLLRESIAVLVEIGLEIGGETGRTIYAKASSLWPVAEMFSDRVRPAKPAA